VFDRLEDHNMKRLLDRGVRVTINSDDPAYFGGYVGDNYVAAVEALGLTRDDVVTLALNSLDATFLPDPGKANGAAVIVAPGGAFRWLSMNNEGWKVAKALADRGIAAFVLKYRLQPTEPSLDTFKEKMAQGFGPPPPPSGAQAGEAPPRPPRPDLSNQLADAEAAYALIVKRAEEWGVDARRIGMIGFSAGAGLTMHSTLHSKTMKLAFIGPIYGNMGPVDVPKDAPPMFVAIASDDFLFRGQFGLIKSWFDAGRPVEFHLYQNGGHGFGLGYPDRTSNGWFPVFMHWLEVNKFLVSTAPPVR